MTAIRGLAIAASLIAPALSAASCGGTTGSAEEEVVKSVRSYTAGLSAGDGALACEHMTEAARRELVAFARSHRFGPAADCRSNVKRFAGRLSGNVQRQIRDADVARISVDGGRATVRMEDGGPNLLTMRLVDGRWRVDRAFARGWRLVGSPSFGAPGS